MEDVKPDVTPEWRAAIRVKDFLVRAEEVPADADVDMIMQERIERCADSAGFLCARAMLLNAGMGSQLLKEQVLRA